MHKRTESGEKYWWDVLMIKTRFVFAVSLVAMLAVGSAWADAPAAGESLGNPHDVYQTQLPTDAKGIAGVSYVNKAVNVAGASAQAAEAHAAAAGQYALEAKESADLAEESAKSANDALANKQAKSTAAYQMGDVGGGWTTMTAAQQNALNSGVTSATKVTHTANTAAGTTTRPVYVTSGGVATAVTGVSIPYGAESNPTSWVTIWVE